MLSAVCDELVARGLSMMPACQAVNHGCFKIVLRPALAVPGLPGRDVVSRSGIGSADLIMK
jgi:hypothetical protein